MSIPHAKNMSLELHTQNLTCKDGDEQIEAIPRPAERLLHPCPAPNGSYSLSNRDVKPERPFFCWIVWKRERLPVRILCAYACWKRKLLWEKKMTEDEKLEQKWYLIARNINTGMSYMLTSIPQYLIHWCIEHIMYSNCQLHNWATRTTWLAFSGHYERYFRMNFIS